MVMDRDAYEAWLGALSLPDRAFALLAIMHSLTVSVRAIFIDYLDDAETRWRLAYKISEMNHAFTSAAQSALDGQLSYSNNDIIGILLEHSNNPELEHHGWFALESVYELMSQRNMLR